MLSRESKREREKGTPMEHNERALEAARSGASEAALWKALRGRKGRRALNELLSSNPSSAANSQCMSKQDREKAVDEYAGLSPGSLEDILSSLPPPPEGANDKDYAAYAAAAAQYTQQAASALKIDVDSIQNGVYRGGDRVGVGLPLLPGMEEAAALLRASGAVGVGPSSSGALDTHGLQESILEDTLGKSGAAGVGLPSYGCPLPGGPGSGDRGFGIGPKHGKGKGAVSGGSGAHGNGVVVPSTGNSIVSFWDMDADKTEQEKLRAFWLGLSEDARRDLVKIEKQAILKEMKGQQKYICSCSVCGRRREVLEEELEMLYDAYYAELALDKKAREIENRARQQGGGAVSSQQPEAKRSRLLPSAAFDGESSEDSSGEATLANSLTVRGDMLTICDELLADDGKRFFDLLLKIAESRYHYRDELSGLDAAEFDDDDFDDLSEEDDDLTDESDDDDTDNEDSDYLEEQRMEEGRRMFQMFAARMIEQRLLVAYREKCSLEAQEQLIREEEEAEREKEERQRIKKEKEKERKKKRKEQKKAQKAAGEAEKLRKQKMEEEAKLEARRKKAVEEKRKKEEREQQRLREERERERELARRARELAEERRRKEEEERERRQQRQKQQKQQPRQDQPQQPPAQQVHPTPPHHQPPAPLLHQPTFHQPAYHQATFHQPPSPLPPQQQQQQQQHQGERSEILSLLPTDLLDSLEL